MIKALQLLPIWYLEISFTNQTPSEPGETAKVSAEEFEIVFGSVVLFFSHRVSMCFDGVLSQGNLAHFVKLESVGHLDLGTWKQCK